MTPTELPKNLDSLSDVNLLDEMRKEINKLEVIRNKLYNFIYEREKENRSESSM